MYPKRNKNTTLRKHSPEWKLKSDDRWRLNMKQKFLERLAAESR